MSHETDRKNRSRLLPIAILTVLAVTGPSPFAFSAAPPSKPPAKPVTGSVIAGVLVGLDGAPLPRVRLGLIGVRLVTLLGEEVRDLPPKGGAIIDSDGKPIATSESDSAGRFEFKGIRKGRYSIAVQSKQSGKAGAPAWLQSGGTTVFLDVTDAPRVEIGTVNPGKPR